MSDEPHEGAKHILSPHKAEERRALIREALAIWKGVSPTRRPFAPEVVINQRLRSEGFLTMSAAESKEVYRDAYFS
ncbi:hypothetical protein B7486_12990 [cyanobacterium TDX16]|nr:hypothetical protein B7486_12990 [cyanobacterium TDX16]